LKAKARTGPIARQALDPFRRLSRHCERSEAIQEAQSEGWMASSRALLAITAEGAPMRLK
jgi:hypothetical protein